MTQKKLHEKSGFLTRLFARFASNKSERRRRDPTKSRTLRVEALEHREMLSITGWEAPLAASVGAPTESVCVATETCVASTTADYSIAVLPTSLAPTTEEILQEVDATELIVEDPSVFDDLAEEEPVPAFYADGAAYYNLEDLRTHRLDLSGDQSSSSSSAESGFETSGLRSGGGTEPIPYEAGLSWTLSSSISDMNSEDYVNPVLERRCFTDSGSLSSMDYVRVELPPVPYGYYGLVSISGDASSYAAFIPGAASPFGTGNYFQYSGGSTSYFYLAPLNNANPEPKRVIMTTLEGIYPEASGGSTSEYDFIISPSTVTMTVIDDDQWEIGTYVHDGTALETNPDSSEPCKDALVDVRRVANATAQAYYLLSDHYSLDDTYAIETTLVPSGTATHNTDYAVLVDAYPTLNVTLSAGSVSKRVVVRPWKDYIYENDETVVLTASLPVNSPSYSLAQQVGATTIYQAPEFLSGNDSGIVNLDVTDIGFFYGKPSLGDELDYELVLLSHRHCDLEIESVYIGLNNDGSLYWKALPTGQIYDFSVTIHATDSVYEELTDDIYISFTVGWATFTICCVQPNPGTRDAFANDSVGHTFWIIEATSSLKSYCSQTFNSSQSLGTVMSNVPTTVSSYADLVIYSDTAFGYYPINTATAQELLYSEVEGVLTTDSSHLNQVNAYATYEIDSLGLYLNALAFTRSIFMGEYPNNVYKLRSDGYNANSHNCTNVALEAASSAGISITVCYDVQLFPTVSILGIVLEYYEFRGLAPGGLGEDLNNPLLGNTHGHRGSYQLGDSLKWQYII